MSTFITAADYKPYIKDLRLQQTIDADTTLIEDAEDTAIAIVRDALYSRYDIEAVLALTGAARPRQVIRWVVTLALYFLHERLPDRLIPERTVKEYERTLDTLTDIEDGKKSVNLPLLETPEGAPLTKFRWGSQNPKSH